MERIRLLTNTINFDHSTAPSEVFSGILLQYSNHARLDGNEIENIHIFREGTLFKCMKNRCSRYFNRKEDIDKHQINHHKLK